MGEKLVVGPINKGLRNDREPWVIDNDSFPYLHNAIQWRGRIKRKRGTSNLTHLTRYFTSGATTLTLSSGGGNILTGFSGITLQANATIVPGSVTIVDTTAGQTYTDDGAGNLIGNMGGTGSINYATGAVTISMGASDTITATYKYYPNLPVMGLEDLLLDPTAFPGTIGFDTTYAYNIVTSAPYNSYDVSFYKNPPASAPTAYPGYTAKTTWTPLVWSGADYQQFWSTNYQGALWVTNGKPGMQFKTISTVDNITGGPPAIVDITFTSSAGLAVGDFLFINEVQTTTGINFQTGYVKAISVGGNPAKVTVEFPNATIANNGTGGIAQYLTNTVSNTKDGIRWYDGDPTGGGTYPPAQATGWVNFAPPLSSAALSIDDNIAAQYYLVGAKMIYPLRGYLLFFGPYIQTSTGPAIYLQDTVIFSQNGTPYYTCSFTGSVTSPTTVFNPILTPLNQNTSPKVVETATANAYFADITGFGGYVSSGVAQPIVTLVPNEDVLILGYTNAFTRLIFTGNNLIPFLFYRINTELGAGSTFSAVTFDRGALTLGSYGISLCTQVSAQRIDLEIPDQAFEINYTNNGPQRVCSGRDFINEWVYMTYPANDDSSVAKFPNQSLFYNYRDQSWAIIDECFTTYGQFRKVTGDTWASPPAPTWDSWNDPWNSGVSTLLAQQLIAGNQQGYVVIRDTGTAEAPSLNINAISTNTITSPDHCLNENDFIIISGVIGTVGSVINNQVFYVQPIDANTFKIFNPNIPPSTITGTYLGNGMITKLFVPLIQTKQFPLSWGFQRKTRIGPQMYLLTKTSKGQMTLQIYLSQNSLGPESQPPNDPNFNNAMIYSTILYTCPEDEAIGVTPANINLQQLSAGTSNAIWHRINSSLIGDTVQLGFTLSPAQMLDSNLYLQTEEIEIHGFVIDASPSTLLA